MVMREVPLATASAAWLSPDRRLDSRIDAASLYLIRYIRV